MTSTAVLEEDKVKLLGAKKTKYILYKDIHRVEIDPTLSPCDYVVTMFHFIKKGTEKINKAKMPLNEIYNLRDAINEIKNNEEIRA